MDIGGLLFFRKGEKIKKIKEASLNAIADALIFRRM
jgi:hypothetical protein